MKYLLFVLSNISIVSCQADQEKANYFSNNAFGNPIEVLFGEHYKGAVILPKVEADVLNLYKLSVYVSY